MLTFCNYCEITEPDKLDHLGIWECDTCLMTKNTRTTLCEDHVQTVPTRGGIKEVCPSCMLEYQEISL